MQAQQEALVRQQAVSALLRVPEVAVYCGVSTKVVYRWLTDGGLPYHRTPGTGPRGIILVHRADLDAWLRGFRVDPALNTDMRFSLQGRRLLRPVSRASRATASASERQLV